MLNDAAILPSEPIDDFTKTTSVVVQPAHIALERSAKDRDIERRPNWTKDVKCGIWTIIGERIMVLPVLLLSLAKYYKDIASQADLTMYVLEIYSNASVKFFLTMNAFANLLNLFLTTASHGAGTIGSHGAGVTTACLASSTRLGEAAAEAQTVRIRSLMNALILNVLGKKNWYWLEYKLSRT